MEWVCNNMSNLKFNHINWQLHSVKLIIHSLTQAIFLTCTSQLEDMYTHVG